MSLLCSKIDLDLETPKDIYEDAQETIKYLSDVVSSLEKRVLKGEKIEGFAIKPGRKSRIITDQGYKYLEKILGRDKIVKVTEKNIGITDLEKLLDQEEMQEVVKKGFIAFKEGKPKVVTVKNKKK